MENTLIILIAPNVSEQMGGEAMKALQIFQEFKKIKPNTIQITHERNRVELSSRLCENNILYVNDSFLSIALWRSYIFRWLIDVWFSYKAVRLAEIYALKIDKNIDIILHQSEPNSPVVPRKTSKKYINIFGPINGNIYYPKFIRDKETPQAKIRRLFHFPLQIINKFLPGGIRCADVILTAGGARTIRSLKYAGCAEKIIYETIDCGIKDEILDRARIKHHGVNLKFVHYGRLVFHKCTFLIIKSLIKTKYPIALDIIGTGPELEYCKQLVMDLKLESRVNFLKWFPSHGQLLDSLDQYRGLVLPSIEDANGIVVQEALALGLPPICLDWGGPQLLVEHGKSGYLIDAINSDQITKEIAYHLDELSQNALLAEELSKHGHETAKKWRWSTIALEWINIGNGLVARLP